MSSIAATAAVGLVPGSVPAAKSFSAAPKPTSNVFVVNGKAFHFTLFGSGIDPSSIGDFNGQVGVADVQGVGTATYADGYYRAASLRYRHALYERDIRWFRRGDPQGCLCAGLTLSLSMRSV